MMTLCACMCVCARWQPVKSGVCERECAEGMETSMANDVICEQWRVEGWDDP